MKKNIIIITILIIALLSSVLTIFNTINSAYNNRDFLFNDSGITRIHLKIDTDFDINYIEELVTSVTEHKKDNIDVKVDTSNNREIIINMDYTESIIIENLTDRLNREYGNSIQISKVESIRNENASEARFKIFIILIIELIITIIIIIGCISLIKKN